MNEAVPKDLLPLVIETPDLTSLREVFPLHDVDALDEHAEDEAQAERARAILHALITGVDAAMRALVTQTWNRHGYDVRWTAEESRVGDIADWSRREGDTVAYPNEDFDEHSAMQDLRERVWATAWDQLDTEAIWTAAHRQGASHDSS